MLDLAGGFRMKKRSKRIKTGTVIFIIFIMLLAAYACIIAEDSNRRADQMIAEVDRLTDGIGR